MQKTCFFQRFSVHEQEKIHPVYDFPVCCTDSNLIAYDAKAANTAGRQAGCSGIKRFRYLAERIDTPSMIRTKVLHFIS